MKELIKVSKDLPFFEHICFGLEDVMGNSYGVDYCRHPVTGIMHLAIAELKENGYRYDADLSEETYKRCHETLEDKIDFAKEKIIDKCWGEDIHGILSQGVLTWKGIDKEQADYFFEKVDFKDDHELLKKVADYRERKLMNRYVINLQAKSDLVEEKLKQGQTRQEILMNMVDISQKQKNKIELMQAMKKIYDKWRVDKDDPEFQKMADEFDREYEEFMKGISK